MPVCVICALTVAVMALLAWLAWRIPDERPDLLDRHTCPRCGRDRRSIEAESCMSAGTCWFNREGTEA